MRTILVIIALLLSEILSGQEICLTDKEYNDLLVATNCTEIVKADSVLLWDKQHEINLQSEYIAGQKEVITITEKQLKKTKRQMFKWKFGAILSGIVGVVSNVYLIFH